MPDLAANSSFPAASHHLIPGTAGVLQVRLHRDIEAAGNDSATSKGLQSVVPQQAGRRLVQGLEPAGTFPNLIRTIA
jgi:hypothetical protein